MSIENNAPQPGLWTEIEDVNTLQIVEKCRSLIDAYQNGNLGDCVLPEGSAPNFTEEQTEERLRYFTLPMSLNYRRNSTQLWTAAQLTYEDESTHAAFSPDVAERFSLTELQDMLVKHKVAMQPTRHTLNWHTISKTIQEEWGSINNLLAACDYDFLALKEAVQKTHKSGFPYLSGPKLFNYWSFILGAKCGVSLQNKEHIDIAVDTHVLKSTVALGAVTQDESKTFSTEEIASRWRNILAGTDMAPVDLNVPLWFWSRNGLIQIS